MYLFDFLKRLFRRSNIMVIIYLVINVCIIAFAIKLLLHFLELYGTTFAGFVDITDEKQYKTCFLGGLLVYGVCLLITLSPIGEFIVRRQAGCRVIQKVDQINIIEPIFREVYDKAKIIDSSLLNNVRLYINEDRSPNAFAIGRRTICITEGLLSETPEHIKAILAHEFGHLSHKDTDVILIVRIGNLVVDIVVAILSILIAILKYIMAVIVGVLLIIFIKIVAVCTGSNVQGVLMGFIYMVMSLYYPMLVYYFFSGLWTRLGFWLIHLSNRNKEYDADEFSFNCGYGDALCEFLARYRDGGETMERLFAVLAKSHPDSESRIAKLQALGANYYETIRIEQENYQPAYGGGNQQASNVVPFLGRQYPKKTRADEE